MSDQPESLVLVMLHRLDEKQDRMIADMTEVKQRLTALEIQVGNLSGTESSHYGQTMLRLDRMASDVTRIRTRLDLVPAEG